MNGRLDDPIQMEIISNCNKKRESLQNRKERIL